MERRGEKRKNSASDESYEWSATRPMQQGLRWDSFQSWDPDVMERSHVMERSRVIANILSHEPGPYALEFMEYVKGLKVIHFASEMTAAVSDHSSLHTAKWNEFAYGNKCIESGTITGYTFSPGPRPDVHLHVRWDCGAEKLYSYMNGDWGNLRAVDLAPAGYLAPMFYCDLCYQPGMGFMFRCVSDKCAPKTGAGVLYDLCSKHYNANGHSVDHPFQCNIPTSKIEENEQLVLPLRSESESYNLIGLYPNAIVAPLHNHQSYCDGEDALEEGRILRIVHDGGQVEISKAKRKRWRCSAEVDPEPYSTEKQRQLQYWNIGAAGEVKLKAIEPALSDSIYASHFPTIDFELLKEMSKYQKSLHKMDNGECCWMRKCDTSNGPHEKWWSLHVTDTPLTHIAEEENIWAYCYGELKVLNLIRNELVMLPYRIAEFPKLELLCIAFNSFTEIPQVVFELTSLTHLNMIGNQISTVPLEIGKLSKLTTLYLGRNKLRLLPDIFHQLPELIEAGFDDNLLTQLPRSFASLTKLKRVELGHNLFTTFPDVLLYLRELRVLNIEHNRIQHFPPHFEFLRKRLASFQHEGNPLQQPHLLSGSESILPAQDASYGSVPFPMANPQQRRTLRVLVVGVCGSGKTSVVQAIGKQIYVTPVIGREHDHTVGINRYFFPTDMINGVQELSVWDFAGEKTYAMMTEMFLAGGTLIWLAVNLEKLHPNDEASYHENVGVWVKSILTRIPRPVVWIVCTHADKCTKDEVKAKCTRIKRHVREVCDTFSDKIDEDLKIKEKEMEADSQESLPSQTLLKADLNRLHELASGPGFLRNHLEVVPLTNTYGFKGQEVLHQKLHDLSNSEPFQHLSEPLYDQWVAAAEFLRGFSNDLVTDFKPPIVTRAEAHSLLKRWLPPNEIDHLIEHLHQNGEILLKFQSIHKHFLEDRLILDVDWLISLFKEVFRHEFEEYIKNKSKKLRLHRYITSTDLKNALEEKKANGVISTKLLKQLWALEGVTKENFPTIIGLLEGFGLAYESKDPIPGYLFPWFLSYNFDPPPKADAGAEHVTIRYHLCYTPQGLFERFIVLCKKHLNFTSTFRNAVEAYWDDDDLYGIPISLYLTYSPDPDNCFGGKIEMYAYASDSVVSGNGNYECVWKIQMRLVEELESLLREWPGHNASRFALCPGCVEAHEADPHAFELEYLYPGPCSTSRATEQCHLCGGRQLQRPRGIPRRKIVPPEQYRLKPHDMNHAEQMPVQPTPAETRREGVYQEGTLYQTPLPAGRGSSTGLHQHPLAAVPMLDPHGLTVSPVASPKLSPRSQDRSQSDAGLPRQQFSTSPLIQQQHVAIPRQGRRSSRENLGLPYLSPYTAPSIGQGHIQEPNTPGYPLDGNPSQLDNTSVYQQYPSELVVPGRTSDVTHHIPEYSTTGNVHRRASAGYVQQSFRHLQQQPPTSQPEMQSSPSVDHSDVMIRALQCHRPLTSDDFVRICAKINMRITSWPMLARWLGISDQDIDSLSRSAYAHPIPEPHELSYQYLSKWLSLKGKYATVASLTRSVKNANQSSAWTEALAVLLLLST